ncbi:MAG TPA: hypothetical protein VL651_08110 [Bacteroidia bacterium]|jgi:hypothetical protein|nr:hypothetical protein [Bacteroidia bacterium]
MENQPQKEKSNRRLHAVYLTIIFLLAGLCVFLSFQYKTLKTVIATHEVTIEQVIKEKDDVTTELTDLRTNYDQLKTNDAALNAEIDAKKKYIDSLLVIANAHKDDKYIIAKLKKETNTLREIMKGYVRTIDSLNTLNKQLIVDKQNVLTQLDDQKNKTDQVIQDKNKLQSRIDRAAMLSTLNVRAVGVKSSKGGKKDTETNKASKVDKIKVNFDIADNDLTIAGAHDLYIRVITPDAQEMSEALDANHQFTFGNTTAYFAAKKTIDYENQPMSVLVNCNKAKDATLQPGKYIIEIYSDQVMIGTCGLVLE